jgi:hypothetical protein
MCKKKKARMSATTICSTCQHLVRANPESATGASATLPCVLWAEDEGHGFCLEVRNKGTCDVAIFIQRRGEAGFPLADSPVTLLNSDGTVVMNSNGEPARATPFQEEFRFRGGGRRGGSDVQKFELDECEQVVAIGVLCVRREPSVCPLCDVEFCLSLSCGWKPYYKVAPAFSDGNFANGASSFSVTGSVNCRLDADTINVRNLRAQLVTCTGCRSDSNNAVLQTVPLVLNPSMSDQATYRFTGVRASCFRVQIVCTSGVSASSGNAIAIGTPLASSECQLVNGASTIEIDPIQIVCTDCVDRTVIVRGTAQCSAATTAAGFAIGDVTVKLFPCVKNLAPSGGVIPCGTADSVACGTALMTTTFSQVLPASGVFEFRDIPENCYLVQFSCTSTGAILTATGGAGGTLTCQNFCRAITNLGTITLNCNCATSTINISGSVFSNTDPTNSAAPNTAGVIARLFRCAGTPGTTAAGATTCGTIITPRVLVASSTVTDTGIYSFNGVPKGCYTIRFFCIACTSSSTADTGSTLTEIGAIPCNGYISNIVLGPMGIDTAACGSIPVTYTVVCGAGGGVVAAVSLNIFLYSNGSCTTALDTFSLPPTADGIFNFCIPAGVAFRVQAVCNNTARTPLSDLTPCELITAPASRTLELDTCVCTAAVSATAAYATLGGVVRNTTMAPRAATQTLAQQKAAIAALRSSRLAGSCQLCSTVGATKPPAAVTVGTFRVGPVGPVGPVSLAAVTKPKTVTLSGSIEMIRRSLFQMFVKITPVISLPQARLSPAVRLPIINGNWKVQLLAGKYKVEIIDIFNRKQIEFHDDDYSNDQYLTAIF